MSHFTDRMREIVRDQPEPVTRTEKAAHHAAGVSVRMRQRVTLAVKRAKWKAMFR